MSSRNKSRKKAKPKNNILNDINDALSALRAVHNLQQNIAVDLSNTQTTSSSSPEDKSVSSEGLDGNVTGTGLQWYEKFHDEKLNNVETRLGAKASELINEIKIDFGQKLSDHKDSNIKFLVSSIVSVVVAFVIFYFTALNTMEGSVRDHISKDLKLLEREMMEFRNTIGEIRLALSTITENKESKKTEPRTHKMPNKDN